MIEKVSQTHHRSKLADVKELPRNIVHLRKLHAQFLTEYRRQIAELNRKIERFNWLPAKLDPQLERLLDELV